MTKITKGTEVYLIGDWNHSHTACVRKVVVTSFGKVRGTAVSIENGCTVKHFLYPEQVGKSVFAVADVPDIDALAMEKAIEVKARWTAYYRERAYWYANDGGDSYHVNMTKQAKIQIDQQPNFIFV